MGQGRGESVRAPQPGGMPLAHSSLCPGLGWRVRPGVGSQPPAPCAALPGRHWSRSRPPGSLGQGALLR